MIPRFSPGELAANGRDPYEKPGLFTRVTIVVLTLHVALFVVPWLWFCVLKPQEKKVFVMSASLVEMPKGNSLDVPPTQPKVPAKPDLPDIPDVPDAPDQKIPEIPEPPAPEPPKPEPPKPAPKPEPPKPAPPKPVPAPKPKPVPAPKPKPKPKPQEKKYLSADDIKKKIEEQRKNPANRKQRQKAEAARKRAAREAARAAAKAAADRKRILDDAARAVKQYGTPDGGSKGVPATKEFYNYIDRLTSLLYQQWDQPTSTELKKRGVFVLVTLQIGADGTLQTKNFKPSGNAVMDQSVRKLLQKLRVVPAPPGGAMTVPVKLIVSD